jgi:predicted amidohydrolase YtcJ
MLVDRQKARPRPSPAASVQRPQASTVIVASRSLPAACRRQLASRRTPAGIGGGRRRIRGSAAAERVLQVLRSATTNGAKAMGRDDLGAIAPGKLADVVLLDADPLADVANLSHAVHVVKGGVVYDPKALIDRIR